MSTYPTAPETPTTPTTPRAPQSQPQQPQEPLYIRRNRQRTPNPAFPTKLAHLRTTLYPFVPLPSGPAHPSFPPTLLHYHLLTEAQLDSIAQYYHQCFSPSHPLAQSSLPYIPSVWTYSYPACMNWNWGFLAHVGAKLGEVVRVNVKRRMVGKFIGLRGRETPGWERRERAVWEGAENERRWMVKWLEGGRVWY